MCVSHLWYLQNNLLLRCVVRKTIIFTVIVVLRLCLTMVTATLNWNTSFACRCTMTTTRCNYWFSSYILWCSIDLWQLCFGFKNRGTYSRKNCKLWSVRFEFNLIWTNQWCLVVLFVWLKKCLCFCVINEIVFSFDSDFNVPFAYRTFSFDLMTDLMRFFCRIVIIQ